MMMGGVVCRGGDVPTEAISAGLPAHRVALYKVYQQLPETVYEDVAERSIGVQGIGAAWMRTPRGQTAELSAYPQEGTFG